jgi:putative DNA primase/helicase
LTAEHRVAVYSGGVYGIDRTAFSAAVGHQLFNHYRPAHVSAVEGYLAGRLYEADRLLPDHLDRPLLNCTNGMLDLVTSKLLAHSPDYLSSTQIPIPWDPSAACPMYDKWLGLVIPDQDEDGRITSQVNDLEEVTSTMLDPSRTPTKAVFPFGPSRSGKSTWLRLMAAIAGARNTSSVTLHQLTLGLSGDRFAAANVYGKILNSAADISSAHVEDISIFKMLTGEDLIHANRKYGGQFSFTNRALFAFSANEVPTVGESSRAYSERIKPFRFGQSFAGHEDPNIEDAMMQELPGILVRWVRAWQRLRQRGGYLPTAEAVSEEFETQSDRVRQFVVEHCTIHEAVSAGSYLPQDQVTSKRVLAHAFNNWAIMNGGSKMGERKIVNRLTCINGVTEVRVEDGVTRGLRGLNITVASYL